MEFSNPGLCSPTCRVTERTVADRRFDRQSSFRWTAGFGGEVLLFWHLSFEGDALIRKFSLDDLKLTDQNFPCLHSVLSREAIPAVL